MRPANLLVFILAAAHSAAAQSSSPQTETPKTTVEATVTYEDLTRDLKPWREARIFVVKPFTKRKVLYATIAETNRFSRNDTELMAGHYLPLSERWTLLLEGSISPTHKFLAKWTGLAQVDYNFGGGWIAHGSIRHREYDAALVNMGNVGVEKYVNNLRFAYSFNAAHIDDAGFAKAHTVAASFYYGADSDNSVNVHLSRGSEVENILPVGVLRTTVRSIYLNGVHWLSPHWGLSYAGNWHEQGAAYTRRGATLGFRYRL